MTRLLLSVFLFFSFLAQAEDALWEENKLTHLQPFPGRVLAVESSWGGYTLIIESISDEAKRYCIAQIFSVGFPHLEYKEVQKSDLPKPGAMMVFLNPSIDINRFSWSMGVHRIGKIFGDEDCLKKAVAMEMERQIQNGKQNAANDGENL